MNTYDWTELFGYARPLREFREDLMFAIEAGERALRASRR